ncbi:MAG TPA: hypothetical protein PLT50_03620 [bacterium]|nr:hypothetical protein [bacterium]
MGEKFTTDTERTRLQNLTEKARTFVMERDFDIETFITSNKAEIEREWVGKRPEPVDLEIYAREVLAEGLAFVRSVNDAGNFEQTLRNLTPEMKAHCSGCIRVSQYEIEKILTPEEVIKRREIDSQLLELLDSPL